MGPRSLGRVSDFIVKLLDCTCGELPEMNMWILATNGIIHERMLNAIRSQAEKRSSIIDQLDDVDAVDS